MQETKENVNLYFYWKTQKSTLKKNSIQDLGNTQTSQLRPVAFSITGFSYSAGYTGKRLYLN